MFSMFVAVFVLLLLILNLRIYMHRCFLVSIYMFSCMDVAVFVLILQSTLVISKSKGPSETLRDIRISTYQIWRIEENTSGTSKFHKWTCDLTPLVRNIG